MDGITEVQGRNDIDAALREIAKVKETAEHVASGDGSDTDQTRVVAGLVHQLAEQVERLFTPMRATLIGGAPMGGGAVGDAPIGEETTFPEEAPVPLGDEARLR
jgi:hypothetical protein